MNVRAVILAGKQGERLGALAQRLTLAAVPVAGRYRLIDFVLSSCANSAIYDVVVLPRTNTFDLTEHIGDGRTWSLEKSPTGSVQIVYPFAGRNRSGWYKGTADAIAQNMCFLREGNPDYLLILPAEHIYQMDYNSLLETHREKKADATVCAITVPMEDASRYGIFDVQNDGKVRGFVEKPSIPPSNLSSMNVYVFNFAILERVIQEDMLSETSSHDLSRDIIPRMIAEGLRVFAYNYGGYWVSIGTIEAYWAVHMDFLGIPPSINFNDQTWVISSHSRNHPPGTTIYAGSQITDCQIAEGCVIESGAVVERSCLSPGVYIGSGAHIRESIIWGYSYISANAVIERTILGEVCFVGEQTHVGKLDNRELRITTVGGYSNIPHTFTIGHGVNLGAQLRQQDFQQFSDRIIPSGTTFGI